MFLSAFIFDFFIRFDHFIAIYHIFSFNLNEQIMIIRRNAAVTVSDCSTTDSCTVTVASRTVTVQL